MLKVFQGAFGLDLIHEKPFSDAMTQVSKNKLIHNHLNLYSMKFSISALKNKTKKIK